MELVELLQQISQLAKDKGISPIFCCGGVPRDKVLNGKITEITDLDLTTGYKGSLYLPKELSLKYGYSVKTMDDGHSSVTIDGFKLDFSSNFNMPGIKELLQKAGLKNPTSMQLELFSRDFTCNALLMDLDLKTIKDPTGLGVKDIEKKLLRTCLPAKYTLGSDNKRCIRIIYLSAKLGFEIDPEIIDWVKKNPQTIANAKPKYIATKLQKAVDYDLERTIKFLDDTGTWKFIQPTPELLPYVSKKHGRI